MAVYSVFCILYSTRHFSLCLSPVSCQIHLLVWTQTVNGIVEHAESEGRRAHHVIRVARHGEPGSWIRVNPDDARPPFVSRLGFLLCLLPQPGNRSQPRQGQKQEPVET